MKQLTESWQNLKPNEQLLIKIAGAVFVVFFIHFAIFTPINSKIDKAEKELKKQQDLVQYVADSVAKIKASGQRANTSNASLTQVINRTSGRYQIGISKMQPKDNTVRLTLEQVKFNNLVQWLEHLVSKQGVVINSIDINKADAGGFVTVSRLVLEK